MKEKMSYGSGPLNALSPKTDRETLYVIKIGGNIIDDEAELNRFLKTFSEIKSPFEGIGNARKILVHGGGKSATQLAEKLGVVQNMVEGRRITDAETLKIAIMVYAGYINKNIVAQLQGCGCNAMGLCGADGNAILAHKRDHPAIDYGFVGDIDEVNTGVVKNLLEQNITVVFAPITHNKEGQLLNTNADTIAQELAKAMSTIYDVQLIYLFEKSGVLKDINDEDSVIRKLTRSYYGELKSPVEKTGSAKIFAGMIPKLDNAFKALDSGVKKVIIGRAEQLKELIIGESGTNIVNE